MEEKNELNDIILNRGGSNAGSKKLLLAIATLTLVLIIVLVIMNSLKTDEGQKPVKAILPPEPTAPTEIINDPLFEPVEVIQEGAAPAQGKDLDQVAQKIKEESFQNTPNSQQATPAPTETIPAVATPVKTAAPAVQSAVPVQQPKTTTLTATAPAPKAPVKAVSTPAPTPAASEPKKATIVKTSKPAVIATKPAAEKATPAKKAEPKTEPKPEVKADVKAEPKVEAKTAAAPASSSNQGTYYIQVGSFTQEPNKALFERLNASGMKYTTQKSGNVTKILVGPFQGEKSVNDAIGTVRQNIEPKAFRIKG